MLWETYLDFNKFLHEPNDLHIRFQKRWRFVIVTPSDDEKLFEFKILHSGTRNSKWMLLRGNPEQTIRSVTKLGVALYLIAINKDWYFHSFDEKLRVWDHLFIESIECSFLHLFIFLPQALTSAKSGKVQPGGNAEMVATNLLPRC